MRAPEKNKGGPRVALVCCQHGDERFGLRIYEWFRPRLKEYPGLKLILANPKAVELNRRFVDQDLNRSYPGSPGGCYEDRRAHAIAKQVREADYVLDIHTSTTPLRPTPIIGNLSAGTRRILNLCNSKRIVRMPMLLARKSLFAVNPNSVAIETGAAFARRAGAREEVVRIVEGLLTGVRKPARERQVYRVEGAIPTSVSMPEKAVNFGFYRPIDGHVFLSGEKAYKGLHHGFKLDRPQEVII